MLDCILVTCLPCTSLFLSLEECMEGRAMLDWILETSLILFLTISLSRAVYGGEELC
jgi:hypothetical protein